jgi:hypothetical protein
MHVARDGAQSDVLTYRRNTPTRTQKEKGRDLKKGFFEQFQEVEVQCQPDDVLYVSLTLIVAGFK